MTFKLSTVARNAGMDAFDAWMNTGTSAAKIEIRTGSHPTNPEDTATGSVIATLTMSNPAFKVAANGKIDANPITADTSTYSGTAGHFRMYTRNGTAAMDGTISTSGGADLIFDDINFTTGGQASINPFSVSIPE